MSDRRKDVCLCFSSRLRRHGNGAKRISSPLKPTQRSAGSGAIEKSAESVYNRLTPAQQDAARRLFLRLVTPGEGQEDTRARSLLPDDPQQREVIKLFSDPKIRLLVTG